jgi:hypothetical protein
VKSSTGNAVGLVIATGLIWVATPAHAGDHYSDAISINLAIGSDGTVSGKQTGGAGSSFGGWMNMTRVTANNANYAASADNSGWTSWAFDSNLTASGAGLGSFRIDLYDGGWGANTTWNDPANGANTLGRSGVSNGNMPNNWGPTSLSIDFNSIPSSLVTDGYDLYALVGATRNSGSGLSWVKLNTAELLYSTNPPPYTLNSLGMRSVAAVQILLGPLSPGPTVIVR